MNICPHCGAQAREDYQAEFLCGTIRESRSPGCYRNEIRQQAERIAALTSVGQYAMDYIDGKHRDYSRVVEGWRKATE